MDENDKTLNKIAEKIRDTCIKKQIQSIAINTNLKQPKNIFTFKYILQKTLRGSNLDIHLHLDNIKVLTDVTDINHVLKSFHTSEFAGHSGSKRMYNTIKLFFNWHGMKKDIEKFVSECSICEKIKVTKYTQVPREITSIGTKAFDEVYTDFIGPIEPASCEGHRYIFTATCSLTKFLIAVPTKSMDAETTANCIMENIILRYNRPTKLISDNGPNFISNVIKQLAKKFDYQHKFILPYHPKSNIDERSHRNLSSYMRAFIGKKQDQWHRIVNYAVFSYNQTVNSVTNKTPHQLVHGFTIEMPNAITKGKTPIYNYDEYHNVILAQLQDAWDLARKMLIEARGKNNEKYNSKLNVNQLPPEYRINDLILAKKQKPDGKYDTIYEGPFRITAVPGKNHVWIKRGKKKPEKISVEFIKRAKGNYEKVPPEIFPEEALDLDDINEIVDQIRKQESDQNEQN